VAWAAGRLPTPHGPLGVSWRAGADAFALTVAAPRGTRGEIAVPTGGRTVTVRVDGRTAWTGTRAKAYRARSEDGYVVLSDVGSGTHTITVRPLD
jgi:uncharacterized protein YraI